MTNYDDYFTNDDKPFAENFNDALLLSNVFDFTVPIEIPTMFGNSTWVNSTSRRKCGVAIVTLKETLPSGISISTSDNKSVLTGTGTVQLGFYPNFNSFGRIKSMTWDSTGSIVVNLKTTEGTTIASNISKGNITNQSSHLRTLKEIVIEIVFSNATLKTFNVVMENKQTERYGANVGIDDVNGLEDRLESLENRDSQLFNLVYPIGSIYMSVNSTNPQTLFGGTWVRLKDRFLLGSGDTYTNGSTGGSKDAVVVSHNHTQNAHNHAPSTNEQMRFLTSDANIHINTKNRVFPNEGGNAFYVYTDDYANGIVEAANTTNATATNNSSGEDGTDKNMPPYLAVYMWKRTA